MPIVYQWFILQITSDDFFKFDYIFGKDEDNIRDLKRSKPPGATAIIELFGKYHTKPNTIIRDPYYVSEVFFYAK